MKNLIAFAAFALWKDTDLGLRLLESKNTTTKWQNNDGRIINGRQDNSCDPARFHYSPIYYSANKKSADFFRHQPIG